MPRLLTRRALFHLAGTAGAAMLASCDPPRLPRAEDYLPKAKIRVVTISTHWAEVARRVGGDAVVVECLMAPKETPKPEAAKSAVAASAATGAVADALPPWQPDPFQFKYSAAHFFDFSSASLVVLNGLGMEPWYTKELRDKLEEDVSVIIVGELLAKEEIIYPNGPDGEPDPCVWNSPAMIIKAAEAIRDELSGMVDEKAAPFFEYNCHQFILKMSETKRWMEEKLAESKSKGQFALISHDNLRYFAKEMGLETHALFKANGEPSAYSKEETLEWLKEKGVNVLCHDISIDNEMKAKIMEKYTVVRPKPYFSRWLDRPGGMMPVAASHLPVSTCEGALKSIVSTMESRRLGGEKRFGESAAPETAKKPAP
jgi:ABC-type Zn uptake system ZnuABC Zn-binding protein ZnuA